MFSRRQGNTIMISGDYQYRAMTSGSSSQRFWHHPKKCAITHFLPPSQGDMVLDVGCGSGVIASFLSEFGASVIGLDANEEAIAFACGTYGSDTVSFQKAFADELANTSGR